MLSLLVVWTHILLFVTNYLPFKKSGFNNLTVDSLLIRTLKLYLRF